MDAIKIRLTEDVLVDTKKHMHETVPIPRWVAFSRFMCCVVKSMCSAVGRQVVIGAPSMGDDLCQCLDWQMAISTANLRPDEVRELLRTVLRLKSYSGPVLVYSSDPSEFDKFDHRGVDFVLKR